MHFSTKNFLKITRNYTAKHATHNIYLSCKQRLDTNRDSTQVCFFFFFFLVGESARCYSDHKISHKSY